MGLNQCVSRIRRPWPSRCLGGAAPRTAPREAMAKDLCYYADLHWQMTCATMRSSTSSPFCQLFVDGVACHPGNPPRCGSRPLCGCGHHVGCCYGLLLAPSVSGSGHAALSGSGHAAVWWPWKSVAEQIAGSLGSAQATLGILAGCGVPLFGNRWCRLPGPKPAGLSLDWSSAWTSRLSPSVVLA